MDTRDIGRLVTDPRYTVDNMVEPILKITPQDDILSRLGIFREVGHSSRYVQFERKEYTITLLDETPRGMPGMTQGDVVREKFALGSQYFRFDDSLTAQDLQDLPAFGQPNFYETFESKLMERSSTHLMKFSATHEWLRWGAIRGKVLSADGQREIYDVYADFGEEQKSVDFDLGDASSNTPMAAVREMRRYIEDNLFGESFMGYMVFCSHEFFDKLINHPYFIDTFTRQGITSAMNPILQDVYANFTIGGVTFVEYNGTTSYYDNATKTMVKHRFIPAGEAYAIPMGTTNTFKTYFTPGTMIDAVNRPGLPIYVAMKEMDYRQGISIMYECAPLHVVQNPRLVIKCISTT